MAAKKLVLSPIVDDRQAQAGFKRLQSGAAGVVGSFAGIGAKGHATFSGLATAMSATGLPGQFSQLTSLVSGVSLGLDELARKKLPKFLIGGGVGLSALAGVAQQVASPLEDAQAQLKQSVANAGAQWSQVARPVAAHEKSMQSLGFAYADTDKALSLLTQGLGSPQKALQELGLTADLAARSGGNLADSATTVVKAFGKSPMVLRQFGINTNDITAAGKTAVAAQKAHTKALADQQKAQQELTDLQARLGVSGNTKAAAATAAVTAAQNELASAGQHLQEVQARISSGSGNTAANQLALEAAQNRVAQATAKLDQAQAKASDTAGLSVAQQQELTKAQQKLSDANSLVDTTGQQAAATQGDLSKANLSGQQILDMLTKKTHGLAEAQSKTFGGELRKWKATVIDFGATWGEKFAKPLIAIGPALAGVGTLVEIGFFGKIARGIGGLVGGIGSAGKALGGLLGIGGKAAAPALPSPTAAGPAVAAGAAAEEPLSGAATQLEAAARALQEAAGSLSGAAGEESGAAGALDTAGAGLDTAGAGLDSAGAGLNAAAPELSTAGAGLNGAVAGLDGSATNLDASALDLEGAAGVSGAGGLLGGGKGMLGKLGLAAGLAGAGYAAGSLIRGHAGPTGVRTELGDVATGAGFGAAVGSVVPGVGTALGAAVGGLGGAIFGLIGEHQSVKPTAQLGAGTISYLEGIASGAIKSPDITVAGALAQLKAAGVKGYALGGIVPGPIGAPQLALVHGGEEITPAGRSRSSGPESGTFHNELQIFGDIHVSAANLDDLHRQLLAEKRRANFSGEGMPGDH